MNTFPSGNPYLQLVDSGEATEAPTAAVAAAGDSGEIPYDDVLQAELEDKGPGILREQNAITVRTTTPEKYNSALWYVLKYGLRYEYDGETFTIYPP